MTVSPTTQLAMSLLRLHLLFVHLCHSRGVFKAFLLHWILRPWQNLCGHLSSTLGREKFLSHSPYSWVGKIFAMIWGKRYKKLCQSCSWSSCPCGFSLGTPVLGFLVATRGQQSHRRVGWHHLGKCLYSSLQLTVWGLLCLFLGYGEHFLFLYFHFFTYVWGAYACVDVCFVSAHVWAGVHTCVCTCIWKPEDNLGYHPQEAVYLPCDRVCH